MTEERIAQTRWIAPSAIQSRVEARSIKPEGVERLRAKIARLGFQVDKPLRVYPVAGGYRLIDGNHRLTAAERLGLETVPAVIVDPPADSLAEIQQARESNEASETVIPTTFVDDAELIWRLSDEKFTQEKIAQAMGGDWSRSAVSNYVLLKSIDENAWRIIATTFSNIVETDESDVVADNATTVAISVFTEGLIRNILDLTPAQQTELCALLVKGKDKKGHKFSKADFKSGATWYRGLNVLSNDVETRLKEIPNPDRQAYVTTVQDALASNDEYVDEYLKDKKPGPKFLKLVQAQIDDWQQKNHVRILIKDMRHLTDADIPAESVDCIITDPPYPREYIELFDDLGALAARVLKPGGSLVVMTGQRYLPRYLELLGKHLTYHWTLAYLTPGGQAVQLWNEEVNTFWKPVLWFVKDERDARWVSDVVKTPVNGNDKEHHHWGQGIEGMTELVEKFSNPGDQVLDPFLGGGTTGVVCKKLQRKFIGVEVDEAEAVKAIARIHEGTPE